MTTMLQFPKPKAKLLPIIGWLASNNRYESNKSCSAPVACSAWNFNHRGRTVFCFYIVESFSCSTILWSCFLASAHFQPFLKATIDPAINLTQLKEMDF